MSKESLEIPIGAEINGPLEEELLQDPYNERIAGVPRPPN